jgi:hypothetical protein
VQLCGGRSPARRRWSLIASEIVADHFPPVAGTVRFARPNG